MLRIYLIALSILLFSSLCFSKGYDVYGLGVYDVKLDGSTTQLAGDFRYERRFDNSLVDIGPESENFFYLKPFVGIQLTSDSASYIVGGVYLEDNLGTLFSGKKSNIILTPSFGVGLYEDGNGKQLGNNIQFRSSFEISYQLESKNRIALSLGHISNANISDINPGVEMLSLSYQIPFN
ncbi:acyloxyacyl hydrolase [Alphaproteobacteria bacterium]|nr:acyloxyacyl hydrolase [Alphaproteobacteria bacterium]